MNTLIGINPWDMQPDETTKAFEAFKVYRDMGPKRSRKAAVEKMTGKTNTCGNFDQWSVKYHWVSRINAYDRYLDQQATAKKVEDIREMAERHSTMAVVFLNKVVSRLQNIDPNSLSADQLLKWFEVASKVERLSRGEATEFIKNEDNSNLNTIDLTKLDDNEFDTIHSILVRAIDIRTSTTRSSKKKERETNKVCEGLLSPV